MCYLRKKNRLSVEMKSYCRRASLDDYIIFVSNPR